MTSCVESAEIGHRCPVNMLEDMTMEAGPHVAALEALQLELGDAVRTDLAALDEARADKSGHVAATPPLAVVEARSIADVQAVLRFASAHGIPGRSISTFSPLELRPSAR